MSSTKEADAHSVEDYMDYIESLSMALLERVANLSDNNGNTALHYAGITQEFKLAIRKETKSSLFSITLSMGYRQSST